MGHSTPTVHLGPHHIYEIIELESQNFTNTYVASNSVFGYKLLVGACKGRSTPTVHFGPHHISKTIRARKLKCYNR